MKFALGVPLMHRGEDNAFLTGEAIGQLAQAAEKAGYDALYITEHPIPGDKWLRFGGHHAPDPFVGLAFAAAVTTKLRLLTNLTVVPYRNPFLLAKTVATLDRMSNGRVILGVGTGYLKPEYFAMGVDFEERNELFDESLEVMRMTWTGESVTYKGRHFDAREVRALPRPAQETVPIWIGGNSKLTRRRVAEKAQGWMPMPNPPDVARTTRSPVVETLDDLKPMLAYMREHAESVGRREPIDIMFMCSEGGSPEDPNFNAQQHLEALKAQEAIGINWSAINGAEASAEAAYDALHRYADEVISKQ
jgi:probable F420-dependent oxidoreductase